MNKKKTYLILALILLILFASLILFALFGNRIASNSPDTVGNTAGNLNNGGYFCEADGKVYFANSYDSGSMYCMDAFEQKLTKLNNVTTGNILAGGNYLYYFRYGNAGTTGLGNVRSPKSFNRCKVDGSYTTALTNDTIVTGQLVGDYLYLLSAGKEHPVFYKIKTDKTNRQTLAEYTINPACAADGAIYFNGTVSDHYLYRLQTSDDVVQKVWEGNLWYPALEGDYIYYMDVENNYCICRYSLSQGTTQVLTTERTDCFNVGYGYLYYQTNGDSPRLMVMRTDGSQPQVVADGIFTNINMTSQYVYFQEFGNDTATFHSALGSTSYDVFHAAREAAEANLQK